MSSVASSFSISMHSLKPAPTTTAKPLLPTHNQNTSFQGPSLSDAKRVFSIAELKRSSVVAVWRRGLEIHARTAGASKSIEVEVDKPLGLTLGQKPGGGVVITVIWAVAVLCGLYVIL